MTKMILLIVGPSGVGKSSAIQGCELENCSFFDLDDEAVKSARARGNGDDNTTIESLMSHFGDDEKFFAFGIKVITELQEQHPESHFVIDVGAGFQKGSEAQRLNQIYKVIAFMASPAKSYERIVKKRNDSRSFEDYRDEEFSPGRKAVYNSAHETIDTSEQNLEQSQTELLKICL